MLKILRACRLKSKLEVDPLRRKKNEKLEKKYDYYRTSFMKTDRLSM